MKILKCFKAHPWIVGLKESYLSNLKLEVEGMNIPRFTELMNFKIFILEKNFFI